MRHDYFELRMDREMARIVQQSAVRATREMTWIAGDGDDAAPAKIRDWSVYERFFFWVKWIASYTVGLASRMIIDRRQPNRGALNLA